MELIVVIVILAILAAILVPGLLKWIDQARDKKYELEAREIALAAEAAAVKLYADGSVEITQAYHGTLYPGMDYTAFWSMILEETKKLTDADVKSVYLQGKGFNPEVDGGFQERSWDGSVAGFNIRFISSDGVTISAYYLGGSEIECYGNKYHTPTDGWEITKIP